ncbi:MAG: type II/IV secretion system ATPase subunit [Candidatus Thermoplasmatota archaeon]
MGLLEKARNKRQETNQEENVDKFEEETGLLMKTKQKKPTVEQKEKEEEFTGVDSGEGREIIEEKKGFGYKGMGTRRIVFDHSINEHIYEVDEPVLNDFEKKVKKKLVHLFKMLADINVSDKTKEEKEKYLRETLDRIVADNKIRFAPKEKLPEKKGLSFTSRKELTDVEKKSRDKIYYHIFREFLGYGRIEIIMEDEGIEDISCDGADVPVFLYHKKYEEITTNVKFENSEELESFVVRLSQICGKQISIYSPIVDGKLPDGSRLQTTLGGTITRDSTFTIRRFSENPLTPIDLLNFESISLDMAAYFWLAIERGASILFCGGTASGKTTALNALSLFIPPQNKIVSIEDTREVNLPHKNWIPGTTREGFSTGDTKTGKDIDMFDLIRAALRQRPKVIMVGEVRGREAYSLFQAMATGHTAYSTVHASTIHTLIQRLENPPIKLPRALLTSLDIIVFQNAIDIAGTTVRRMTSVTEVVKLDPDTNQLIFMEPFKWVSKTDDRFESSRGSRIMNEIKQENDWTDEQLQEELENRKTILRWMQQENIRDYKQVGRVVADYLKYPEEVLQRAEEALNR